MIREFKNKNIFAAGIFSSAACQLKCKYCYIYKGDLMGDLQKKIKVKLRGKTFINDLEKVYGKNLKHLALWGAEPTLTLKEIEKALPDLLKRFPKLKEIFISTNLMTSPKIILSFIRTLAKATRKVRFSIQISLDGPAFITDVNRIKGAAKKIPENFFYLIKELNKINLKNTEIVFSFKPTLTLDNIKMLNRNVPRLKKYFDYFDLIFQRYRELNKNEHVHIFYFCTPTVAIPGRYTSRDGKSLALFFKNLRILARKNKEKHYWKYINGSLNCYTYRFNRSIADLNESLVKLSMFTCSGGKNNFALGINKDLHICHRTFYLNEKKYIDNLLSQKDIKNWDGNLLRNKKPNMDLINKNYIADITNKDNCIKTMYVLRNYHDFTKLKIFYTIAFLKELALAGQCGKEYLRNNNLATLFAIFINSCLACQSENLLNVGVIHFIPASLIRLFANGAFKEILRDYKEWQST